MTIEEQILKLRDRIAKARSERDRIDGQLQLFRKELKSLAGTEDTQEAVGVLARWKKQRRQIEADVSAKLDKLEGTFR